MLIKTLPFLYMIIGLLPLDASSKEVLDINVKRNMTCGDGSIMGTLYIDGEEIGRTLELPYRNNERNVSFIPTGNYQTFMREISNK